MYPIDVAHLVRRGTLGSRANDPTLPRRRRRESRLMQALVRSRATERQRGLGLPTAAPFGDRLDAH